MRPTTIFFICMLSGFARISHAEIVLVRDGKPTSVIVMADKPLNWQQTAADELRYHLFKMTDADVPIVRSSEFQEDRKIAVILVGQSPRLARLGIDTTKLKRETLVIRTVGNTLVLAGEDGFAGSKPERLDPEYITVRTGTMHAVYTFLQDRLGCHWLWPGETGEVIPRRKTVSVGNLDIVETPKMFQRHLRLVLNRRNRDYYARKLAPYFENVEDLFDRISRDEAQWFKRMRLGRSAYIAAGHSFTRHWERYGESHPEIFALRENGARNPANRPNTVKMCVANPALWEIQLAEYAKAYKARPELYVSLKCCENDGNDHFCECRLCRAWDWKPTEQECARLAKEGWDVERLRSMTALDDDGLPQRLSHRYARWRNEIARRVRKINPDALVTAYAYNRYSTTPIGMKLEPNLLIGLVLGDVYPKTPEKLAGTRHLLKQWELTGAQLYVRPNSLYFGGHCVPYIFTKQICDDLKAYIKAGVRSTDYDSLLGYWATTGPTYYALARMLWDTNLTGDGILEGEYYPAFGPMAPIVKEYFDYWETFTTRAWTDPTLKARGKALSPRSNTRARVMLIGEVYTGEDFARGRAILDRAKPLLAQATPEQRERFENLVIGLRHAEMTARSMVDSRRLRLTNKPALDIRDAAANIQDLVRLRTKIGTRNVLNVLYATNTERRLYWYVNRLHWFRDLQGLTGVYLLKSNYWMVRYDPDNTGEAKGWYNPENRDTSGWLRGEVREKKNWNNGYVGTVYRKEHGKPYAGPVAWYRIDFPAPKASPGKRLGVLVTDVRGAPRVWINGRYIGEAPPRTTDDANRLELLIPEDLREADTWLLVVKVIHDGPDGGLSGWPYVFERRVEQ